MKNKIKIFEEFLLGENLAVATAPVADDDKGFANGLRAFAMCDNVIPKVEGVVYRMPDEDGQVCFDFAVAKPSPTREENEVLKDKVVVGAIFAGFTVTLVGGETPYEVRLKA